MQIQNMYTYVYNLNLNKLDKIYSLKIIKLYRQIAVNIIK